MKDKWLAFAAFLYFANMFGWLVFIILKIARGEA
jgi:hypothetical protein